MFDRRSGLGDATSTISTLATVGGSLATSWITSSAQSSIAKTQARTDALTAAAQNRLREVQSQLDLERARSRDAAITKWVLYGGTALTVLGVVALVLRRR